MQEPVSESSVALNHLKCAKCNGNLVQPYQLPGCFHILCSSCFIMLESSSSPNLICPKCNQQNARHSVLRSISGIDDTSHSYNQCDYLCGKPALWYCFLCGQYFCASCRPNHDIFNKGHQLTLLPQPTNDVSNNIFAANSQQTYLTSTQSPPILEVEAIDGGGISKITCPLCNLSNCTHNDDLVKIKKNPDPQVGRCSIQGHDNQELKFFCLECWIPVCGDCSQKGEHKIHETNDLFSLRNYLQESKMTSQAKLTMCAQRLELDINEKRAVEQSLKKHIEETDSEIKSRKCKAIEDATDAFNDIVKQIELQGKDILYEYKDKLHQTESCRKFIDIFQETLDHLIVGENLNILQYNHAFRCQQAISKILDEMCKKISTLQKSHERYFVLPEIVYTPLVSLARAGTEWKHLKLAFKFQLHDIFYVHSIIVLGSEQCLISCGNLDTEPGVIVYYNHDVISGKSMKRSYDVGKGRYLIAQTSNREIVASYSSKNGKEYSIQYNDGNFINSDDNNPWMYIKFQDIKQVHYPVFGIATTSDDKILLCCQMSEKKDTNYILKLSLQGKILCDSMTEGSSNMMCPNYIAVSNNGEIAVSDTEGSSVVLLDKDLNISERINFRFPTSFNDHLLPTSVNEEWSKSSVFKPYGLCYDSYQRIIVTDPENNSVVRLSRDYSTGKYTMEPLLVKTAQEPHFTSPKLVAMGEDSRLWVVCKEYVFVYDYCT